MTIKPLGAGQEVGRSCVLLKFKGKQIMVGFDTSVTLVVSAWAWARTRIPHRVTHRYDVCCVCVLDPSDGLRYTSGVERHDGLAIL
jgi:hypothetical protein